MNKSTIIFGMILLIGAVAQAQARRTEAPPSSVSPLHALVANFGKLSEQEITNLADRVANNQSLRTDLEVIAEMAYRYDNHWNLSKPLTAEESKRLAKRYGETILHNPSLVDYFEVNAAKPHATSRAMRDARNARNPKQLPHFDFSRILHKTRALGAK